MRRLRSTRFVLLAVIVCVVLAAGLAGGSSAWAATMRSGNRVVVPATETFDDDLYASAGEITIDGTVEGDVYVAAQRVVINGPVKGDVVAMAQVVVINAPIEDDVHALAQVVRLGKDARVGGDLVCAEYSLQAESGSLIRRDMMTAGYQVLLEGQIWGGVRAACVALELDGSVGGDVIAQVGDEQDDEGPPPTAFMPQAEVQMPTVPVGLTLGDKASVGGKLTYTSKARADIAPGAKVGGATVHRLPKPEKDEREAAPTVVSWGLDQIRRLVALLLVGLLIVWLLPGWANDVGEKIRSKTLPSLGWGVVALFAFFTAAIGVLFVSLILAILFGAATVGDMVKFVLSIGFLVEVVLITGFALYVAVGAPTIIGLLGGRWLLERWRPGVAAERVVPLLVGILVLWALTAVPILGAFVSLALTLFGLGGVWLWLMDRLRRPALDPSQAGTPPAA